MITVRLPSMLRGSGPAEFTVARPVGTIEALVAWLDAERPGFRAQVDDTLFNFAVNDELILHRARQHPLKPGDTVEIIPTIAGG
jgi:molybdopterin converting factor small subunit